MSGATHRVLPKLLHIDAVLQHPALVCFPWHRIKVKVVWCSVGLASFRVFERRCQIRKEGLFFMLGTVGVKIDCTIRRLFLYFLHFYCADPAGEGGVSTRQHRRHCRPA